jgi:tetratricopeptide (TPR) repeat protein
MESSLLPREVAAMPEPSPTPVPSTGTVLTTPPEPAASGTLADPAPAPPPDVSPPLLAGRYRPLRPLGKGGLGEVFVALDGELNREVALKEVQARHLGSPDTVARFLREAEVTAHLEHPGVVPVYGLGLHADGRPYYAMRLIRGESLQHGLESFHKDGASPSGERVVAFRGLLRRFVDVCNAVAYAHARGVIHRDLKPDNVMLGPYGETLVIDWGMAKRIGRSEDAAAPAEGSVRLSAQAGVAAHTEPGSVAGTPAYMSPEQAAGQVEGLTSASDVYALGAVLYALLTGRPAFGGKDLLNLLADVRLGAFAPPRQVNRSAPAALEAVCLKGMALRPEARYGSAKELAAEVERWLADEPVHAYREPWTARLGRWARRFRTLVTSLGVLLLTLTAALAVGLVLVNRERENTAEALKRLAEEQGKTKRALDRSEAAEKSASQQRRLALKTVRRVVDQIHERLKDQPNQQELRKELLNEALAGLKEVARAADTTEADHATIWALLELGDIFQQIEIGGLAEARKQYEQAHQLARRLAEADPRSPQAQRDLSVSLERLGDAQVKQGDSQGALASFREALEIHREQAEADPLSAAAQRDLSVCLSKLGDVQLKQGGSQGALASFREALGICRQLAQAEPLSAQAQRDLSVLLSKLGDVQLEQGDTKGALASFQEELGIDRLLAGADSRSAQAQRDLAHSLERIGDVQLRRGDAKGALASVQESLGIHRRLAEGDPRSALAQREVSVSLTKLGDMQFKQGDAKGALASFREALRVSRQLAEADPRSALAQRDLAVSLGRLADVQLRQRDAEGALASVQEALAVSRRVADADPHSAQAQSDLSVALSKLGEVQLWQADVKGALASFREALAICRRLAEADRRSALAQRNLAVSLTKLGDAQVDQGDAKGALASYQEALGVSRRLAEADPHSAAAQRDLLISYTKLGNLARDSTDYRQAADWYVKALEVAKAFPRPEVFHEEVGFVEGLLRFCRFVELVQRKDLDGAVQAAEKLAGSAARADEVYDAACAFALCVPLADKDEARDRLAARAVGLLKQAVARGYKDVAHLKKDPDLDPLRRRDDFQKLLAEIEKSQPETKP